MDALPSPAGTQRHEVDRIIAAVAARQEQVISLAQLQDAGLSGRAVRGRVGAGRLFARHRAVYSLTPTVSRLGEFWAAVLTCGPGAALSHQSAAHVHGIRRHGWGDPHVTVASTGTRRRKGIHVHCAAALTSVVVNGLVITDIARTLTDLVDVLTPSALRQAVAHAERKELIDRATYVPLPGRKRIMDQPHLFTRSENERAMCALCEKHRLWLPLVNQTIGDWEVDFFWPEFRRAIELDSWFTHKDPITFERDRLKDEDLHLNHDIIVRRVTDTRLHNTPDDVAALLRRLLR